MQSFPRLHEAYRFLDKQTARILLLHELLGLRISDTLTLKVTDIVMEPKPHLKILQQKTGNYLKKSINNDILLLLNASIKETYETYGEQEYIFVCDKDPKSPLPYKTVYYRLQVLINTHDLKDDHGNPLTAGTHIFRRTYGKKLCDLNLDDVTNCFRDRSSRHRIRCKLPPHEFQSAGCKYENCH